MQKILTLCALLCCLYGCSTRVYTHQQVMQSLLTKGDVLKHLGVPDEVKGGNQLEEWEYYHQIAYNPNQSAKRDTTVISHIISDTTNTPQITQHDCYVRFLFDPQGNVTGYKSSSVDLSYSKKDSFGTATLKVLGIAALITVVVGLEIYNNSNINL
jgi:hypothetical protein